MKSIAIKTAMLTAGISLALGGALAPSTASAANRYWACGSDWWDSGACWSLTGGGAGGAGQPQNGDFVYLAYADGVNRTVSYANTLYPSAILSSLVIHAAGTGTITFSQSKDALASNYETVGLSGTGAFSQSGGTNTVATR